MSEENKAVVRRLMDEVWSRGRLDAVDQLLAPDYAGHNLPEGLPSDAEGFKQVMSLYRTAFPDMPITLEDLVAEGDRVVVRWSARGTHGGDLAGIPPTGRPVSVTGIDIYRLAGGKIVENWNQSDQMGMMQQIGAVPSPAGPPA